MKKLNTLVIGSGGREHALAFKLKTSPSVEKVFISPGNGGTSVEYSPGNGGAQLEYSNVDLKFEPPFKKAIRFLKKEKIDLVVLGSEHYLSMGLVDLLTKEGFNTFGPTKEASQLETSKEFAKGIMEEAGVPTARYVVFTDIASARRHIEERQSRFVLKADGLCAGKGVVIPENKEEAIKALDDYFVKKKFGPEGEKILIEDFVEGEEVSVLAFSDGKNVQLLPPSQDYKRIYDQDRGPNTGGMGNYTPVKFLNEKSLEIIKKEIYLPVLRVMEKNGYPFKGILYAGLIVKGDDIKVLEFNARFGDPECQCVLPLLSSDLAEICLACIKGDLTKVDFQLKEHCACTVVLSSKGYPASYEINKPISGLNSINKGLIFHAGTKISDGELVTNGGRVLSISCYDRTLKNAIEKCYEQVNKIHYDNIYYRTDIGRKGL